jgi:hypothetical protein
LRHLVTISLRHQLVPLHPELRTLQQAFVQQREAALPTDQERAQWSEIGAALTEHGSITREFTQPEIERLRRYLYPHLQRPIRYSKRGPGVWTITWRDSAVPDAPEPDELWDEAANKAHLAYQQELAEELAID